MNLFKMKIVSVTEQQVGGPGEGKEGKRWKSRMNRGKGRVGREGRVPI